MNILGAFTFGGLIKTFLPGFVWLIAIVILESDLSRALNAAPDMWMLAKAHEQATLALTIPGSILLGLMSNIIAFMGVNDWLIRSPVRKANPSLFALHDQLTLQIREQCWSRLKIADLSLRTDFIQHSDAELIMLPVIGVDKLSYTREQYWYHLEFQVNLILSIVVGFVSVSLSIVLKTFKYGVTYKLIFEILICFLLAAALCLLLRCAARKNYQRHIAKMLSLMAAVLSAEVKADASQGFRSAPNRLR